MGYLSREVGPHPCPLASTNVTIAPWDHCKVGCFSAWHTGLTWASNVGKHLGH